MNENKVFNYTTIQTDDFVLDKFYDHLIEIPNNNGYTGERGQAQDRDKSIQESQKRSKDKIFGYTLANPWDLWGTLTLNQEKIDRYDLYLQTAKITKWLRNIKQNKYPDLKWLIVPEKHKDGAYHFHFLFMGLPFDVLMVFKKYKQTDKNMYNWPEYQAKWGFSSLIDIRSNTYEERYKISCYLTKYITKELCDIFDKKRYWVSQGLKLPTSKNLSLPETRKEIRYKTDMAELGFLSQGEYYLKNKQTGEINNKCRTVTFSKTI